MKNAEAVTCHDRESGKNENYVKVRGREHDKKGLHFMLRLNKNGAKLQNQVIILISSTVESCY